MKYTKLANVLKVILGCSYTQYRNEMNAAKKRIPEGSSIITTKLGMIEYTVNGEGPPILHLHGAGGGYDLGLMCAQIIGNDYKFIVPSRYGYLRTPIPNDSTFAIQADHFAELLDLLKIDQVVVWGVSAGAQSTLDFALNHSSRCLGIILTFPFIKTIPKPG